MTREDQRDDVAAELNVTNDEKEVLMQQCKVIYFRNMDLKAGDLRVVVDANLSPLHYKFDKILTRGQTWRVSFQNSMWGSVWYVSCEYCVKSLNRGCIPIVARLLFARSLY